MKGVFLGEGFLLHNTKQTSSLIFVEALRVLQRGGQSKLTFLGHCISRARLSSSSCEIGSTRLRKAAFLYKMSLSEDPSKPRSYQSGQDERHHNCSEIKL